MAIPLFGVDLRTQEDKLLWRFTSVDISDVKANETFDSFIAMNTAQYKR
jgi:hypothetical protein